MSDFPCPCCLGMTEHDPTCLVLMLSEEELAAPARDEVSDDCR
jgi:hypothetical protein